MRSIFAIALCLVTILARPSPPSRAEQKTSASTPPKVASAAFEPVYRNAKTEGATLSGVAFVELRSATNLGLAKDDELNLSDEELFTIYQEAYDAYRLSAAGSHTISCK